MCCCASAAVHMLLRECYCVAARMLLCMVKTGSWILMRVHPLFMRASLIVAPNVQLGVATPGGAKNYCCPSNFNLKSRVALPFIM